MTVTATTRDEDARQLAEALRSKASNLTRDHLARAWRQDRGTYAFDVVLPSGREARVIVSVAD